MTGPAVRAMQRAIAGAVHDLRHPVTIIEGQRRLLEDGLLGPLTPAMTEAVQALGRQTVRMTRILEELDAVSRAEMGPIAELDLAEVVQEQWAAQFESPPPRLPSTVIHGDRSACGALVAEVLAFSGPQVVVGLGTTAPSGAVLSVMGPLDGLTADVLWYSRVVARWHGGHLTMSGRDGSGRELRVRFETRVGTRMVPE